jgi:hypothetical protein
MKLRRHGCLWVFAVLFVLAGIFLTTHREIFTAEYWVHHQHCIKAAYLNLEQYAQDHGGSYPFDPRGYPHALLQMDEENYHTFTGPGYDPAALRRAKRDGTPLTEEDCGRVYIQGLTNRCDNQIVLLFDKKPTLGGDHGHPLFRWNQPLGREVCYVGLGMGFVQESDWPAFSRKQVERLVKEGIVREEAERLYELPH